ncbi:hypothetical protein AYI68_g5974 [Smittium mucronatum]|uniref:Uncharacterized protein n=1 Tax=Smittium mucronatum TaxID=133383 RepID=A0A1R0GSR0_9FUNG|nr:hypothetical protein AYI68_g5974 [Smittium mucronatum]
MKDIHIRLIRTFDPNFSETLRAISSTIITLHSRDLKANIAPLLRPSTLRLSTIHLLLTVLTKPGFCTTSTVVIIGDNFTGRLGPKPNESFSKEDTRSSITDSPAKLTDSIKSSPITGNSVEKDV